MKYRLSIANLVGVVVEGQTLDADANAQPFKFVLVCDRLSRTEVLAYLESGGSITAFFAQHAKGWRDQALVVNEDGQPAAFGADALDVLFSIPNVAGLCWEAYKQQVGATAKN